MGLFDMFRKPDFNQLLENYRNTSGAILLDVRTPQEYAGGRVPGSRNIPLQELTKINKMNIEKKTPIFVYCQSGARSRQATMELRQMGYLEVTDLGGIINYSGKVER